MRQILPIGGPVNAGHCGKPIAWWRRALRAIGYAFLRASNCGVRTVNITGLDSRETHHFGSVLGLRVGSYGTAVDPVRPAEAPKT